jgi:hypothetical protein
MQSHCCVFALEVPEDLINYHWIFDASDDLDVAAAALAGLDVDVENTLQALRSGHGGAPILAITKGPLWAHFGPSDPPLDCPLSGHKSHSADV